MTGAQICAARRCSNLVPPKRTEGGPPKLYCGEACAKAEGEARRRDRAPASPPRAGVGICAAPGCGKPARDPGDRGPVPIYCSRKCSDRVRNLVHQAERIARGPLIAVRGCIGCEREFTVELPSKQKYCSPLCRKTTLSRDLGVLPRAERLEIWRQQAEANRAEHVCELPTCGATFKGRPGDGRRARWYCSPEHYAEHRRIEGDAWIPPGELEQRDNRNGPRRVRAAGFGAAIELFDPIEILERDGWRCQLCGVDTPEHLRGSKHQRAPEVDHRIPIIRGGGHTRENCWCLCHRCNHAKGDKLLEEMPPRPSGLFDSIDAGG